MFKTGFEHAGKVTIRPRRDQRLRSTCGPVKATSVTETDSVSAAGGGRERVIDNACGVTSVNKASTMQIQMPIYGMNGRATMPHAVRDSISDAVGDAWGMRASERQ